VIYMLTNLNRQIILLLQSVAKPKGGGWHQRQTRESTSDHVLPRILNIL
jgi:hypothetical protein